MADNERIYQGHWYEFEEKMLRRLEEGHQKYGASSFLNGAQATIFEIEQEALDICGWGFILWVKLQALRRQVEQLEKDLKDNEPSLR